MKLISLLFLLFLFGQHAFCAVVDIIDNAPLKERRIPIDKMFSVLNPKEKPGFHPGIPLSSDVQENSVFTDVNPIYSTVQISDIFKAEAVDDQALRHEKSFGTGFLVIDRTKPFDGVYQPSNLTISADWDAAKIFPKTFLVTNKHVLNSDLESTREKEFGSRWIKGFYKFSFHLMRPSTTDTRIGEFKTAFVTVPLVNLLICHLPDDIAIQPGTTAAIDLAAINIDPIFAAIRDHIIANPILDGFVPFYSSFDTIESFRRIPNIRTQVETFGYPLAMVGGGMLPIFGHGYVSGDIATVENIDGEDDVVDGYFALDIAGGTSGSPVYYSDSTSIVSQTKLAGVVYASNNTSTHRVGRIISAERVKSLMGLL